MASSIVKMGLIFKSCRFNGNFRIFVFNANNWEVNDKFESN